MRRRRSPAPWRERGGAAASGSGCRSVSGTPQSRRGTSLHPSDPRPWRSSWFNGTTGRASDGPCGVPFTVGRHNHRAATTSPLAGSGDHNQGSGDPISQWFTGHGSRRVSVTTVPPGHIARTVRRGLSPRERSTHGDVTTWNSDPCNPPVPSSLGYC